MSKYEIKQIYNKKNYNNILNDSYKILSISVSMANAITWKEKEKSFYKIIANELKEIFDNKLLSGMQFKKISNSFYRTEISGTSILFLKNNIFSDSDELLEIGDFLKQNLIKTEKNVPEYLTTGQLNELLGKLNDKEKNIINEAYPTQELNTNKFYLNDKRLNLDLINIFEKDNYFSINIIDYINIMHDNYDYNYDSEDYKNKIFKDTFNNYILELGAYIASVIKNNID